MQMYNIIMALNYRLNFVSAQYLKKKMMHMHLPDLRWDCMHQFLQIYNRVMALGCCQGFVSSQYLVNGWMEFDQILHMH